MPIFSPSNHLRRRNTSLWVLSERAESIRVSLLSESGSGCFVKWQGRLGEVRDFILGRGCTLH